MRRVAEHSGGTLISDDGRHARRDRNRELVASAFIQLVREGNQRPSVAEVAERSGVSYRSVFRYYADHLELAQSAIALMYRRAPTIVPMHVGPDDELDQRIDGLVDHRLRMHAEVHQMARLLRSLAVVHPALQDELTHVRALARDDIATLFAAELERLDAADGADLLAMIHVATSFESLELLLGDHGMDPDRVRRLVAGSLQQQLDALLGARLGML